jgi:hypothetical protein
VTEKGTDRKSGKAVAGAGDGKVRVVTDAVGGEAQDLIEGGRARVSPGVRGTPSRVHDRRLQAIAQ